MEWDSINSIPSFLLTGLSRSGVTTSYEYDINGRRTKKVANGVTTEYYYSGEQYTGMHTSDGKDVGAILDASGSLYGIYYDDSTIGTDVGQTYYFVYNGQGDVIGLYNHGGKLIATYAYDAWGRCIEAKAVTADDDGHAVTDPDHIAFINPFRYRGYMYDAESGLYYVGNRYYDPETGRFINADTITDGGAKLLGYNLFIYAANNPTNYSDATGQWIFKDAIKWVAKNIVKPIVKKVQETLSKVDCTQSVGFTGSASPGIFMFSGSVGVSWDTKGNVVLQASGNVDVTTTATPTWSVTKHHTTTNAPTVNDLQGPGYEMGGSAQIPLTPVVVGAEGIFLENTQTDETYYGVTYSGGIGSGYEFHAGGGGTTNVSQTFNVFDELDKLYIKIMEW